MYVVCIYCVHEMFCVYVFYGRMSCVSMILLLAYVRLVFLCFYV